MKIHNMQQHFIDWSAVGGYEKFIADYNEAPNYQQKRILIESLPLQTNPEWLGARRGHITASKMKDFLGMDRSGKKPGEAYKKVVKTLVAEQFGWEEAELTWNDKASVKRGLLMEKRALELFKEATGIELKPILDLSAQKLTVCHLDIALMHIQTKMGKLTVWLK